jgi:hypothetical protein
MSNPLLYALCGLIVGALVGLTGVGGGSLMTPILVLVFGQAPAVAVGTDLVFSASTKLVATASYGFSRRVDWRIVGRLAVGSSGGRRGHHLVLVEPPAPRHRGSADLAMPCRDLGHRGRCAAAARSVEAPGTEIYRRLAERRRAA